MYIAALIFRPGEVDSEFRRLSAIIDEVAISLPGFIGAESWRSTNGLLASTTYYWRDQESLKSFASAPIYLDAKRQFSKWYDGYCIVISKVERVYGDGSIEHIALNSRKQVFRA